MYTLKYFCVWLVPRPRGMSSCCRYSRMPATKWQIWLNFPCNRVNFPLHENNNRITEAGTGLKLPSFPSQGSASIFSSFKILSFLGRKSPKAVEAVSQRIWTPKPTSWNQQSFLFQTRLSNLLCVFACRLVGQWIPPRSIISGQLM